MASKKKNNSAAKKSNNKRGSRPANQKAMPAKANPFNLKEIFANMKKGETTRFIIGLVLICIALFLAISFISFVLTGREDAVNLEVITSGSGEITHVNNRGGILGLKSANYFMQHCFGFTAIFIPLFMLLLSLKLMKTHIIRITQYFIYCAFLMIWGSVFLAYLFPDGLDIFKPGGDHGINISNFVISKIGEIGLVMVLAVTMIIFCIYLTSKTIDFVRSLMHPERPIKGLTNKWREHHENFKDQASTDPDNTLDDTNNAEGGAENGLNGAENTGDNSNAASSGDYSDEERAQVIDLSDNQPDTTQEGDNALPIDGEASAHNNANSTGGNGDSTNGNGNSTNGNGDSTGGNDNGSNNTNKNGEVELEIQNTADDDSNGGDFASRGSLSTTYDPKLDFEYYKYPTVTLLKHYSQDDTKIDMDEQQANKERIINVLRNFGVEISSIKATVGPTITLYEITPAKGVRIVKIRNLEDDIALSLSAIGIRIIAPIPGKGTIGIEVPNAKPKIVSMESVINSRKFKECDYELPIALGRTITNEIFIQDLAKCPHLLVAGATGQGKSVGLNAIITSLLFKKHPTELKFVLIDPKKVEFSVYAPLEKNYMAEIPESEGDPVVTNTERVKQTLKSLCQEMDDRYSLLKTAHCRNLKEYNQKFISRKLNPDNGHRYLPYIVVIIDEFGDLIMTAGKEIELPITRIAQLARAVGIHMVIATQRPTTNIITGSIKANFPARMAFRVMAAVDSRTILDQMGANQLIGRGDMLYLASGKLPERVQCAFVDTPEVEAICDFISHQDGPLQPYILPEVAMDENDGGDYGAGGDGAVVRYDSMFADVARFVVNNQQGSTSAIQRTFSIGYNRAGRLMDQLEKAQIVGPARGSKPRDVLILDESTLNAKMEAMHII